MQRVPKQLQHLTTSSLSMRAYSIQGAGGEGEELAVVRAIPLALPQGARGENRTSFTTFNCTLNR